MSSSGPHEHCIHVIYKLHAVNIAINIKIIANNTSKKSIAKLSALVCGFNYCTQKAEVGGSL